MTGFDLYTFFLCLIVFTLLTGIFTFFVVTMIKMGIRLTLSGHDDESILKEQNTPEKKSKFYYVETAVTVLLCILIIATFVFSVTVNVRDDKYFENIPTIKVVNSASMAKKHKKNTYLTDYNLNNQFSTFDLILVYKVPPASELKKFDIVLYETEEMQVIHRIIDIEPPNEIHPEEYWFTCKGDAVESIDRFPVRYDQIKAIYKNEKIPMVGSFISFMQSPAGLLCILLVVFGMIAIPIAEKKYISARKERYEDILDIIAEAKREKQEAALEKQKAAEQEEQLAAELERLKAIELEMQKASEVSDTENKSAVTAEDNTEKLSPFAHLANRSSKTFRQKLRKYKDARIAFTELKTYIETFDKTRLIESDKHDTFKRGNTPIARFAIRGKTLYAYLALPPAEFSESKYVFTDVSDKSAYKNYPMLLKITSQRQLRWTRELIDEIAKRGNMVRKTSPLELTKEAIEKAAEELMKELYEENADELNMRREELDNKHEELSSRHTELENRHEELSARHTELESRHEELNARHEAQNSRDAELKNKDAELSAREEDLKKRVEEFERQKESEKKDRFAHLATRNPKTFRQKLRKFKEARLAFNELKTYIESFENVRLIESDKHDTFKRGNLPVARFTIRGKTLYAYLALPPAEFTESKYVFTDVSDKPSYKNYPMLVKLTSLRQIRWTKELIDDIATRGNMKNKDAESTSVLQSKK